MNILKAPDGSIILSPDLNEDTKLYRYMPLSRFMGIVENKQTSVSHIKSWEDTWELPSTRIPVRFDDGPLQKHFHYGESLYGQCWSLHEESDAMWRIYSLQKEGVVIQTSVKQFSSLKGIKLAALGIVSYCEDVKQAVDKAEKEKTYERFSEAFVKRKAFEHEREVRLVTAADSQCLALKPPSGCLWFNIDCDPTCFIEGIKIDPRADDHYVNDLQNYCKRSGLVCRPTKSTLYGDLYEHTGLVTTYRTAKSARKSKA